ncbi:hypothetical protein E3E22_09765 [Thermococcus sp. MV5]|uniref:hypothetical protein n=1 Tax=Thermococcus sp. MV5 TaxID=1638272 RepID=UPI0014394530|nr:hypothetical protein [Thermococcus sp. MV5]NJE26892.1 hypothetical protein [Thermococcus sp. MV5]
MRIYSFGEETVPAAGISTEDSILIIGSVRTENYKIMLLKLNYGEELKWVKFYEGKEDWEGHSIAKANNGYLIGGAVEGTASPEGGRGWKAYLAKVDENGNKIWERKYRILGNECVYSILPVQGNFLLGGEASDGEGKHLFGMGVDFKGNPLWTKTLGPWKDAVFTGLIKLNEGPVLVGSIKENGWKVISFEFCGGDNIEQKVLDSGIALTVVELNGRPLPAGYRKEELWVSLIGEWELTLGKGVATTVLPVEDGILVGGELEGNAVILKLDFDGRVLWKEELWEDGCIEAVRGGIAVGVREEGEEIVMAIYRLRA